MFVLRARRQLTAALAILMTTALLLAALPAATVLAQSTSDRALETLRGVPGLKAQTQNLHITAETDPESPALWAAMGQVTLNKQLRNWFKPLVNGKLGWGQLPPVGTPVWATFIWLKERPTANGPKSIVVHQGYSDGSKVVSEGPEANPYEVDDTVDSYGLWWREDAGFYPLGASSTVGPSGINWYDTQFAGAGGISKKVMANVVPSDDPTGGGGGGGGGGGAGGGNPPGGGGGNPPGGNNPPGGGGNNPPAGGDGGEAEAADADPGAANAHLVIEEREPKKDPNATRRDHIVWHNGAYRVMRDFAPGDDLATCVRTTGTTTGDGTQIVEVTIQTLLPLDPAELGQTIKLQVFGDGGELLGEVVTEWRSHTPTGPYQGSFVYQGVYELPAWAAGAESVRLAPDADVLAASLEAPGPALAGALAGARIAMAHSANSVALGGTDGAGRCGTLVSDDFDICSAEIVAALTNLSGDMAGGGVVANPYVSPNGVRECHLASGDELIGVLAPSGEAATEEKLEQVASVPGCPEEELSSGDRKVIRLTCELVQIYLWLQEVPGLEAEIGVEDGEIYLDTIMSAVIWPLLPEPVATTRPWSLGEDVPLAAVGELIDGVGAAARASSWRWSVPGGESA